MIPNWKIGNNQFLKKSITFPRKITQIDFQNNLKSYGNHSKQKSYLKCVKKLHQKMSKVIQKNKILKKRMN
jgi:hypothetical protein